MLRVGHQVVAASKRHFSARSPRCKLCLRCVELSGQAAGRKPAACKMSCCDVCGDALQHVILLLQIGYAAVFFWEYFGPMVVYALIYFLPHLVYPWAK